MKLRTKISVRITINACSVGVCLHVHGMNSEPNATLRLGMIHSNPIDYLWDLRTIFSDCIQIYFAVNPSRAASSIGKCAYLFDCATWIIVCECGCTLPLKWVSAAAANLCHTHKTPLSKVICHEWHIYTQSHSTNAQANKWLVIRLAGLRRWPRSWLIERLAAQWQLNGKCMVLSKPSPLGIRLYYLLWSKNAIPCPTHKTRREKTWTLHVGLSVYLRNTNAHTDATSKM